jgi:hypothetical protein
VSVPSRAPLPERMPCPELRVGGLPRRQWRVILARVTAFVSAGAGFLLAVLWFDLMFDVQALPHGGDEIPEHVLASISAYYRRVTTAARPMNWLIATVMLATIASVGIELARDDAPPWVGWASLALAGSAVSLAIGRTVPNAVRLGTSRDALDTQRRLAKSICRDHLCCLAAIATVLILQLSSGR